MHNQKEKQLCDLMSGKYKINNKDNRYCETSEKGILTLPSEY